MAVTHKRFADIVGDLSPERRDRIDKLKEAARADAVAAKLAEPQDEISEPYEVVELTEQEVDDLIQSTLAEIGADLDSLRQQAQEGRFDSDEFRRAWFVIAGLGRG